MQRHLLAASILAVPLLFAGCLPDDSAEEAGVGRTTFFKHGPPSGGAPYSYQLTSYGDPGDSCTGTPACGGKSVDGTWYYATGAYTFGCHSKLKLEANGTCVVVEVVDNGPASSVETKAANKCGGTGYIIDASPLVSKALFGSRSAGWSDCFEIQVTPMPSTTPSGPISCSAAGSGDDEEEPPPDDTDPPPKTQSYCGDGMLDSGELCDTGLPDGAYGACPVVCDDGDPCLQGQVVGSGCQARCKYSNICPEDTCGNGKLDSGELCDTGISDGYAGACPWDCDDGDPCTSDQLVGSGCKVKCLHSNTCPKTYCGDGKLDAGEICDTGIASGYGACPKSCDDGDSCTSDQLIGSGCQAYCKHSGSCPNNPCGNGQLDAGEFCDIGIPNGYPGACPKTCDDSDSCTADQFVGSGCQVKCQHTNTCTTPVCGNGKLEPGEWCDTAIPAGSAGACPKSCNDGNPCTSDILMGSGCLATCANPAIDSCTNTSGGGGQPVTGGRAVGSACGSNSQCISGKCLLASSGFSGGMCSRVCASSCEMPAGEAASACIKLQGDFATLSLTGDASFFCYALCDYALSPTGCRAGYRCVSRQVAAGGKQSSVCLPDSQAGNDAPQTAPTTTTPTTPSGNSMNDQSGMVGGCSVGGSADLSLAGLLLLGLALIRRRAR